MRSDAGLLRRGMMAAALAFLIVPCAARAVPTQDPSFPAGDPPAPPTAPDTPATTEATEADAERMKLDASLLPKELDNVEPFSNWHRHTAPAPETITRIYVLGANGTVQRQGYGVVARCDGFVLAPESLFPPDAPASDRVLIRFASADGEELKEALPAVGPPRFHSPRTPYVLLKINGHHLPCLPMLDARNIRLSAAVKLFRPKPSDTPAAVIESIFTGGQIEDISQKADTFTVRLAEGEEAPPPGTIVTIPDGTASLGIVTSSASGDHGVLVTCASYVYLHWISNDIGLRMVPGEVNNSSSPGMVKVGGGPVRLVGGVATNYRNWYGIDYACCPDFLIDHNPVTIGEYRRWLDPNKAPRQPEAWLESHELELKQRRGDLPIVSIWTQDAMAYAAAHEKRLVTPVEWQRATLGPNLAWYEEYQADLKDARERLEGIDIEKFKLYGDYISNISVNRRPITLREAADMIWCDTPEMRNLNKEERNIFRQWFAKYWFPFQSAPVDAYPKDISRYHVQNVLMNMPEIVLPNFARGLNEAAWKPYASIVEPYFSFIRFQCTYADITQADLDGLFITFFPPHGAKPRVKTVEGKGTTSGGYVYDTSYRSTFRCAR